MYPDQNQPPYQPQQQYSIDYLNQIAPEQPKATGPKPWMIWVIIGGVVVTLIIGALSILGSTSGPTDKLQTLAARLQTLEKTAKSAQKIIKSSNLSSTNSNLAIFLTNANRDIATPLKNNNVDSKKIDKSIAKKESGEELTKSLEDARLNAVYDRTYAREMAFQLTTLKLLMIEIYKGTSSKSLKEYLDATYKNIDPIAKELSQFSAANS